MLVSLLGAYWYFSKRKGDIKKKKKHLSVQDLTSKGPLNESP